MPDWTKPMQQTFEYFVVDPGTWKDQSKLDAKISSSTITRGEEESTLGSATIDCVESIGECYVRIYLVTIQNGIKERFPLATVLVQSPRSGFDGRVQTVSLDAYTPLIELKEKYPDIGYSILKDQNIMEIASRLTREKVRAPVVMGSSDTKLFYDFVANLNDSWLSFLSDLIANAKFKFDLDEMGRIGFAPVQDVASLQPVWEYTDDNSSILYPQIDMERDMYGLPNVVEVIYSTNSGYLYSKVVNDDANSPISTVNRGREVVYRVTDPDVIGNPTQEQMDEYAKQLLRNNSCLEYTVTYTHGYCPVRIGDCVLLNYRRAGIERIKAKVTSQTIKCELGCPVSETAVFTTKLWG